ncbi:alpha/beta fold hydrolase [Dactylosporangium sp. CA-052675]|uniref:alpha/beta fold hydrolase n=1 Tax=Dactylosporangium sp. CA-052675 TaxID=3239927 RepID=UPI003D8FD91F
MQTRLPDGRRLSWTEHGDPAAPPVLFLHGTPGAPGDRPPATGVRLLCVDRPGYGASDPAARPALLGVAGDVEHLLRSLGIERCGVLGFSGGAPFALACAARHPHRLTGVVAASLTGPDRELHTVHGRPRRQAWRLRHVPGLGRRHVTRAAAAFAPHAAGVAADWLATDIHPWRFRLRDVAVRTLIWAGAGDRGRAVPDAPLVAARIPGTEVRIAAHAGHTPAPADWAAMLAWLAGPPALS